MCCESLSDVKFSSGLRSIGEYAFSGCPMNRVEIPEDLPANVARRIPAKEKIVVRRDAESKSEPDEAASDVE